MKCMECGEIFEGWEMSDDYWCPHCNSRDLRVTVWDEETRKLKIKTLKCMDCGALFDSGGFSTGRCPTCSSINTQWILIDAD